MNTAIASESSLIRRLAAHDPQAMSEVYNQYGRIVYSIALRIVRDSAVAEDLTQETFLRVWTRAAGYDENRGRLGVWLSAIARNLSIDYVRSPGARLDRTSESMGTEAMHGQISREGDLADDLHDRDRMERLRAELARLPEHQRRVLDLWYRGELSHSEIAAAVNRPLGTIKTWLRNAIHALRAASPAFSR
jgi:RNA polymerase sigma-70 factor (ECF subfamily)